MANFCSNCGTGLEPNMKFCPKCGAAVAVDQQSEQTTPSAPVVSQFEPQTIPQELLLQKAAVKNPQRSGKGLAVVITAILAVVVVAVASIFFIRSHKFETLLDMAEEAMDNESYDEAETAYKKALDIDKSSVDAWAGLAKATAANESDYAQATSILVDAFEANIKNDDALSELPKELEELWEDAYEYYSARGEGSRFVGIVDSTMEDLSDMELPSLTQQTIKTVADTFRLLGQASANLNNAPSTETVTGEIYEQMNAYAEAYEYGNDIRPDGGSSYVMWYVGDVFYTKWFRFSVLDVTGIDDAHGAVLVTIENTFDEDIVMTSADFSLCWTMQGSTDSIFPLSGEALEKETGGDSLVKGYLPSRYTLKAGERATGYLLYKVPDLEVDGFYILYTEAEANGSKTTAGAFDNYVEGTTFYVNLG